jgi:hypothetical protein
MILSHPGIFASNFFVGDSPLVVREISYDERQVEYNLTSVTGDLVRITIQLAGREDFGKPEWQQINVAVFEKAAANGLRCLKCNDSLMQLMANGGNTFRADCRKCRTQHSIFYNDGVAMVEKRPFTPEQEKMVIEVLVNHESTTDPWHLPIHKAERMMGWKDGTAEFRERVKKIIASGRLQHEPIVAHVSKSVGHHRWVRQNQR